MKLQTLFLTASLAAIATFSTSIFADEKASPAAEVKAEKAVPTQATKPHSHVQEKTGVPQDMQPAEPRKKSAAKDKTKHFHPRDMK